MAGEYIVQTSTSLGYDFDEYAGGIKQERIVRGRDCRYYEELENVIDVSLLDGLNEIKLKEVSRLCTYWATDHVTKPNCFCAWGEPKEVE